MLSSHIRHPSASVLRRFAYGTNSAPSAFGVPAPGALAPAAPGSPGGANGGNIGMGCPANGPMWGMPGNGNAMGNGIAPCIAIPPNGGGVAPGYDVAPGIYIADAGVAEDVA